MGGFVGTLVAGGAAADVMGAVPMKDPATGATTTADGKPVGPAKSGRDHLYTSALIIGGALAALFLGSRALRDARIA